MAALQAGCQARRIQGISLEILPASSSENLILQDIAKGFFILTMCHIQDQPFIHTISQCSKKLQFTVIANYMTLSQFSKQYSR